MHEFVGSSAGMKRKTCVLDRPPKRRGRHERLGRWQVRALEPHDEWTPARTDYVCDWSIEWQPTHGDAERLRVFPRTAPDGRMDLRVWLDGRWETAARLLAEGFRFPGWNKLKLCAADGSYLWHVDHVSDDRTNNRLSNYAIIPAVDNVTKQHSAKLLRAALQA